ncbi:MAG: hypothetical protein ACPGLV_04065 [Bacteroidia bacterium]
MEKMIRRVPLNWLAMVLVIICGNDAMAQGYIPRVAVPAPTAIEDYKRCDEEMVDVYDTRTFKACLDGQKQARYTAEQFALTNGKLHGYLEGFSYALYHATQANRTHQEEMARGQQALYANGPSMQAGIDAGVAQGLQLGVKLGKTDALALWNNAFSNGKVPRDRSSAYYNGSLPEFNMSIASPYEYYVGRKSVDQILKEDVNKSMQIVAVNIPDNQLYLVGNNQYNVWDLWFDNGKYEVQRYKSGGWIDPNKSFEFWQKYSEQLGQYDVNSYSNLPSLYTDKVAKVTKQVRNPDGTTKTTTVSATVNLKQIFKDGFLESYRYYMHHNFNKGFHEYLKMGAFAGEAVGVQIGKRLAFESGYANAYDQKFWADAQKAFEQSYRNAYTKAFDDVFNDYSNHAKLSILNIVTIGEVNDGILSPGEKVKFRIVLENKGAQNTSGLRLSVAGNVTGTINETIGSMYSFETKTFETGYLLQISNGHDVRENIALDFKLSGTNSNVAVFSSRIDVRNQIEAYGLASVSNIDAVEGVAVVMLPFKNVSTNSAAEISADVLINGQVKGNTYIGTVAGSSEQVASVSIKGLDPLQLLDGIPSQIQMKTNGRKIEDAEGAIVIRSKFPIRDISSIYLSTVSANGYRKVSQQKAETKILSLNSDQTMSIRRSANLYKRNSGATIPGQLILQRTKSPTSDKALNDLAVKMWVLNKKSLPVFLSSKRRYYRKLLDQLTISGSVKRAAKS